MVWSQVSRPRLIPPKSQSRSQNLKSRSPLPTNTFQQVSDLLCLLNKTSIINVWIYSLSFVDMRKFSASLKTPCKRNILSGSKGHLSLWLALPLFLPIKRVSGNNKHFVYWFSGIHLLI